MPWPPVILVAEENDDEFVLLRCAFESSRLPHRLIGVTNGAAALDYLYARGDYSNRPAYPFPNLMLLDLHIPVMDGFKLLAAIRNKIEFKHLPIVALASDDNAVSKWMARKLGARDYILKPLSMPDRIDMVRSLHSRWLAECKPPVPERVPVNPWPLLLPGQAPQRQSAPPASRQPQHPISISKARITLIDDDPCFLRAMERLLKCAGCFVTSYNSASEFLASARLEQVDCLITDVQMPGMSGLELCEQLAATNATMPIIVVTGNPTDSDRNRALRAGAASYLGKVVGWETLSAALHSALRGKTQDGALSEH